jgi:hypothetical protein
MADFDIGGGINGAGIARDAAGRGLKAALLEQGDLAAGTSSASSKLIHGGLRHLEHGALRLVRAALSEREVLLRMAPHLIRPLRFVLPLDSHHRSAAPLRLGLFIDMTGRREILPPTRSIDLAVDAIGVPRRGRRFGSEIVTVRSRASSQPKPSKIWLRARRWCRTPPAELARSRRGFAFLRRAAPAFAASLICVK